LSMVGRPYNSRLHAHTRIAISRSLHCLCAIAHSFVVRHGGNDADFFFYNVTGSGLRLEIDLADILADDGDREGLERGDQKEKQHHRGPALDRLARDPGAKDPDVCRDSMEKQNTRWQRRSHWRSTA